LIQQCFSKKEKLMHIKRLTHEELTLTYKLLICDADGTLRRCTVPGQPCPNRPNEWELIPEALAWMRQVDWGNFRMGVASNQGGVAHGFLSEDDAYQMLKDMMIALTDRFPPINSLLICPTNDKNDPDRKPNPGMLLKIMQRYDSAKCFTLMVGDMESDRLAAEAAGCDFIWAWDLFGFDRPVAIC
jgi:D-glycero-D-manno-heptose 1,7-bisphosphate phosphatase